jgi:hypothetical protein
MKNLKNRIVVTLGVVVLLFTGTIGAKAQASGEIGFRFMPSISSMQFKTSSGSTVGGQATLGYGGGIMLAANFSNYVGIEGDVIYNSISQKYADVDVQRKVNLQYVNIPVLLSLNTGINNQVNLNVVGGPQMGINVGSSITTIGDNGNSSQPVLEVKKGDVGLAYGAGIDFALNDKRTTRLGLGFRGVYGLIDISDNSSTTSNNSYYLFDRTHITTYSAYIGLSFLF